MWGFMKQITVLLIMLVSASLSRMVVFALDPKKAITQYVHDVWTVEDGLPQNSILAITQSRDGYLWLGTWEGLVRFDGVRFTVFNRSNTKEIKNNYIYALCEDRQGDLWIGTWAGLNRFKDGKFTTYTTEDGLSSGAIKSIYEDSRGNLWIGTAGGGLNRFSDGKFTNFTSKQGLASDVVEAIYEDRKKNLWVGTWGGLSRFKDGKLTTYTAKVGLPNHAVLSICEDREGYLWVGTSGGLYRLKDGKFTRYTTKEGLSHEQVRSIYEDREGNLWIGTEGGGLSRFHDGKFTHFTARDGLSHDVVWPIYEDREGSLWVGTWGGLNRFKDGIITVFTTKEGLSHNWIRAVYEDQEGSLWIGTLGAGLNLFKHGKFTHYARKEGLVGNTVGAINGDSRGNIWIATEEIGLNCFRQGKFIHYTSKEGLHPARVTSICEDREGTLWLGTSDGWLIHFKDGKFRRFTTEEGPFEGLVTSIYEDRQGNMWIGTGRGMILFKDGKFTDCTAKKGFPHSDVNSIYEDREGTLWFGTRGDGLTRYKKGEFITYSTKDGLFDNVVTAILEDGTGDLWMGSFRGIFRVSKKELEDFAQGKITSVTSVPYGKADGLKSGECNSTPPPGWKSRDGKLWFPTIKGVVVIDPDNAKKNVLPPPVVIEQVIFDNKQLGHKAEFPPGRRELEFHYTALSFLDPKKVRFRYRLEGYDENWIDAGTRRVAYYTHLAPGQYRFRVIACNNDGLWNETGVALDFYLQPHFYETGWFYAICFVLGGLALILVGIGLYHLRNRRLRTWEEAERMAAYGQMMAGVAHDVRKPLMALRIAAHVVGETINGQGHVQSRLNAIQRITTRLASLMDDLLYFAEPKPLQLTQTDIEKLLKEAVETYRDEYDDAFPEIVQKSAKDLPLVAVDRSWMVRVMVNLIENAAKHAQGMTTVTLSAESITDGSPTSEKPSHVCIRVANDGAGMAPENLPKIFQPFFSTGQGTGLGLAVVQEIVKRHCGTITVESKPESGTVFNIRLPTVRGA